MSNCKMFYIRSNKMKLYKIKYIQLQNKKIHYINQCNKSLMQQSVKKRIDNL